MVDIVDSDIIKDNTSVSIEEEFEKLLEDAEITDRVLSCVSRHIVPSKRLQFALEILKVNRNQFLTALTNVGENEGRLNLQVRPKHKYNLFKLRHN